METLTFYDAKEKTISFRLEVDQEPFEKVKEALKPLGFNFRVPGR